MKYIIGFLAIAILAVGCKGNIDSPTSTVTAFLETVKKGDIDGLKKYITKKDISYMQIAEAGESLAKSFGSNVDIKEEMKKAFIEKSKNVTYDIKGEKIDGDKAEVSVEIKQNGEVSSHPFKLEKEDGAWKISLSSTGLNEGTGSHGMNGLDSNINVSDSIGKAIEQIKKIIPDSMASQLKQLKEKSPEGEKMIEDAIKKANQK